MNADTTRSMSEERESLWRLVVSPLIWAAHFMACYVTAAMWGAKQVERTADLTAVRWAVLGYTVVALIGIGLNGWDGWRRHRFGQEELPHNLDTPGDRHRFLGFATVLLAAMSGIATVFAGIVALYFHDCR